LKPLQDNDSSTSVAVGGSFATFTPIKPLQGDQLALDELLPDAPETDHKPIGKALRKRALYQTCKD